MTGRERRCGWIDLVALKYSIMVNGVTQLIMMKSDVLDGFDTIKACVAYKQNGVEIDYFPYDIEEGIEPVGPVPEGVQGLYLILGEAVRDSY